MLIVPSTSRRREAAIQTAKRRIQRLEIETHRIKAELARLEAVNEDEIADELTHEFRQSAWLVVDGSVARPVRAASGEECTLGTSPEPSQKTTPQPAGGPKSSNGKSPESAKRLDPRGKQPQPKKSAASPAIDPLAKSSPAAPRGKRVSRKLLKPAWTVSLGLHVVLLAIAGLATFATLSNERFFLSASASDLPDESYVEPSEVQFEAEPTDEFEPHEMLVDTASYEVGDHMLDALVPTPHSGSLNNSAPVGASDALPGDIGTLMAGSGGGEPGGGKKGGGGVGSASFFGARSQANRVVYVIDNSSSMKDGRLEAAVSELLRSVDAMGARQSFYVIFVSDQPYPMFYPAAAPALIPATAPNKERLRAWLGGLQHAGGKNRQLINAMEMAASLEPETIFFLWDGDLPNEGVRLAVMDYFTRPHNRPFTIHTLGMGVKSPQHELHLSAVAQSHGGTYLRVDLKSPQK